MSFGYSAQNIFGFVRPKFSQTLRQIAYFEGLNCRIELKGAGTSSCASVKVNSFGKQTQFDPNPKGRVVVIEFCKPINVLELMLYQPMHSIETLAALKVGSQRQQQGFGLF